MKTTRFISVLAFFAASLQLFLPVAVQAAPLNVTQQYPDFVVSASLSYSFDATTGILKIGRTENIGTGGNNDGICNQATGENCSGTSSIGSYSAAPSPSPQLQVTNHPTTSTYTELFSLYLDLDNSGNVQSGSFRIDGVVRTSAFIPPFTGCSTAPYCVLYDGSTVSGGLWSGTITDFGWDDATGPSGFIQLTFNNASGIIGSQGLGHQEGAMIFSIANARQTTAGTPLLTDFKTQLTTVSWTATGNGGDVFVPIPGAIWLFGSGFLALLGVARRKSKR